MQTSQWHVGAAQAPPLFPLVQRIIPRLSFDDGNQKPFALRQKAAVVLAKLASSLFSSPLHVLAQALGADHSLEVMCEWDETGSTLIEAKKIGEGGEELMKRVEGPARIPTLKIKEDKKKEVGQEKEEGQEKDDGKKDTKNKKDKEKKEKDQTEERKGECVADGDPGPRILRAVLQPSPTSYQGCLEALKEQCMGLPV
eukprot:833126-Pelagomonas_calceolata.AAC.5